MSKRQTHEEERLSVKARVITKWNTKTYFPPVRRRQQLTKAVVQRTLWVCLHCAGGHSSKLSFLGSPEEKF